MSIPPFLSLPDGVVARTLSTLQGDIAALDAGAPMSTPVGSAVLVPGFTGSKEDFIAVMAPIARRGVRAVAVDLPGQFESPAPPDADLSLAGFAAAVWAVARTLPRPLALVGHSLGGLVVREAVLSHSMAVDAMVLVASGPVAVPAPQQEVLRRFTEVLEQQGLGAVWQAKSALDAAMGAPPPPPEIESFLARRFMANDPRSLVAMIQTLCSAEDETEALAAVAPVTTVVVGGLDDVWPLEQQRTMADRLGAALVELPEAGHSPAVDAPEALADAISELLATRRDAV